MYLITRVCVCGMHVCVCVRVWYAGACVRACVMEVYAYVVRARVRADCIYVRAFPAIFQMEADAHVTPPKLICASKTGETHTY